MKVIKKVVIFFVQIQMIFLILRDIQDMYDEINEKIVDIQGHYDILTNNKYIEDLIELVLN